MAIDTAIISIYFIRIDWIQVDVLYIYIYGILVSDSREFWWSFETNFFTCLIFHVRDDMSDNEPQTLQKTTHKKKSSLWIELVNLFYRKLSSTSPIQLRKCNKYYCIIAIIIQYFFIKWNSQLNMLLAHLLEISPSCIDPISRFRYSWR